MVHCAQGVSRSASVVIAALMTTPLLDPLASGAVAVSSSKAAGGESPVKGGCGERSMRCWRIGPHMCRSELCISPFHSPEASHPRSSSIEQWRPAVVHCCPGDGQGREAVCEPQPRVCAAAQGVEGEGACRPIRNGQEEDLSVRINVLPFLPLARSSIGG